MKIAFLFGHLPTGHRPIDWSVLEDSPRGLTGTDNSFVGYARAMAKRGHEVHAFLVGSQRLSTDGLEVHNFDERGMVDASFDAACSWCEPDNLRGIPANVVRVVDCQLNNFDFVQHGHEQHVDIFVAPSKTLAIRLASMTSTPEKWQVLPNGCDLATYDRSAKIAGKCIYASSPDRGLHLLVQEWPAIKAAVPWATLDIYYHNLDRWFADIPGNAANPYWTNQEHARRSTYIRDRFDRFSEVGITYIGSVSRKRIAQAYSEAEVLAYPCETFARPGEVKSIFREGFTEGFAVAILEGCASGALPIISSIDALGEVYGGHCPMVAPPVLEHAAEWRELVIRALKDHAWRAEWSAKAYALAETHDWSVLGEKMERMLLEAKSRKVARAA